MEEMCITRACIMFLKSLELSWLASHYSMERIQELVTRKYYYADLQLLPISTHCSKNFGEIAYVFWLEGYKSRVGVLYLQIGKVLVMIWFLLLLATLQRLPYKLVQTTIDIFELSKIWTKNSYSPSTLKSIGLWRWYMTSYHK